MSVVTLLLKWGVYNDCNTPHQNNTVLAVQHFPVDTVAKI